VIGLSKHSVVVDTKTSEYEVIVEILGRTEAVVKEEFEKMGAKGVVARNYTGFHGVYAAVTARTDMCVSPFIHRSICFCFWAASWNLPSSTMSSTFDCKRMPISALKRSVLDHQ
jgi:hypothetical protein